MSGQVPKRLKGRYFAPKASSSADAFLEERKNELVVHAIESAEEHVVQFKELGDRLGSLPRKIYFADGSAFECADNDAVDLAFGKDKSFFNKLVRVEGSLRVAAIAFVLTVGVLVGFFTYGLPALANFASWATPSSAVAFIDDGALDTVDRVLFNPSEMDEADRQKYSVIFDELLVASGLEDERFQLLFRDGGRLGANAVALPGGTIILTDQLAALAENDDEIAGVLAHEIGHVTERHSLRQIYRALGIGFMASIVLGDTSQLMDNVVAQAAALDTLTYSRRFELDADIESVNIMTKVGRDPFAFVDLIDRIFEQAGVDGDSDSWVSTHPGNKTRRENVEQQVERLKQ